MKTPEEIKKGLECCTEFFSCDKCPYWGMPCGTECLAVDAFAYIQQLERERDALRADLETVCGRDEINTCPVCGHWRTDWAKPGCELNGLTCAWVWRGVREVD